MRVERGPLGDLEACGLAWDGTVRLALVEVMARLHKGFPQRCSGRAGQPPVGAPTLLLPLLPPPPPKIPSTNRLPGSAGPHAWYQLHDIVSQRPWAHSRRSFPPSPPLQQTCPQR